MLDVPQSPSLLGSVDPTKPLVIEAEKQENNRQESTRNPSWFKPGQSGNLNGRPQKGHSITETIKNILGANPELKKALIEKIINQALEGDMTAAKMIWQYMDGMPSQGVEIATQEGKKYVILLDNQSK